jgi:hypothetical protein|tara:strand:- start:230 stop:973 length:744 start_codon:yes stop_codon:yes gene_type:complete
MKVFYILVGVALLFSCKEEPKLTAHDIVEKAIETSCGGVCDEAEIAFVFRDISYKSYRKSGVFEMERVMEDSIGTIRDVLTNQSFQRFVNDSLVALPDSIARRYAASVNSVHYFVQLPYGLKDPAVEKELLGESTVKGKDYYEIGVTFQQEGGGDDYEDEYVYWINKENFQLDYFAYNYRTNGGGVRFREAYNKRVVKGVRFADYNNYKYNDITFPLIRLDSLYENGQLELLSKIETEQVEVTLLGN